MFPLMNLNISHIRLLKYLSGQSEEISIKNCENFLLETKISLSFAKKYIAYLKHKNMITIQQNPADKRSKLVRINPAIGTIDKYI